MTTLDLGDRSETEGLDVTTPDATAAIAARSPLQLFWRRLKSDKVAMTALVFIIVLILAAVLAPLIIKLVGARPPNEQSTKFIDPEFGTATGPSSENLFGVDTLGRDL